MADIPDKQRQSVGLVSQIPFGAIIGGPLNAAVDAQSAAAVACYDFIRNVGFEPGTTNGNTKGKDIGKVREITFTYDREVPAAPAGGTPAAPTGGTPAAPTGGTAAATTSGTPAKTTTSIKVPLLTVMPLPFIRIESLTVAYKVHITAEDTHTDSTTTSLTGSGTLGVSVGWGLWKANFNASISSKKDSTATNTSKYSVEQTMDVNVHAVQDDMPAGMAKILSLLTEAIAITRA